MDKKLFSFFIMLLVYANAKAQTFKDYYASGKLKSIKHEGTFNGCHMRVSTDSLFYESGEIQSTVHFYNKKDKKDKGCHATWTVETKKEFYENGKLKKVSQLKYSYEGTECDCGEWISYDSKGNVISRKKKGDCYNQKPCQQ